MPLPLPSQTKKKHQPIKNNQTVQSSIEFQLTVKEKIIFITHPFSFLFRITIEKNIYKYCK